MSGRWSWLLTLLLLACQDDEARYGVAAAIAPGHARADLNGDGRLEPDEMARSAPELVRFSVHDQDGDASLDHAELLAHLLDTDPARFEGDPAQRAPSPQDRLRYSTDPVEVRQLRVLFEFMLAEVISSSKRVPLPSDEQLKAAAYTGSLNSEASRAVLSNLVAAYRAAGLEIPPMFADIEPVPAAPGLRTPTQAAERPEAGRRGAHPQQRGGRPPEGQGGRKEQRGPRRDGKGAPPPRRKR
jgi:hypothetical protein